MESEKHLMDAYTKLYDKQEQLRDKQDQRIQESFEKKKEYLEDEVYYNRMTTNDLLWAWRQIQAEYAEGTEQRKEADKEVYKYEQQLKKESLEKSEKWIAEEKSYHRLSLEEEIQAYERLQQKAEWFFGKESDEYKDYTKTLFDLRTEYVSQSVAMLDNEIKYQEHWLEGLDEASIEYQQIIKYIEYLKSIRADKRYEVSKAWISDQEKKGWQYGLTESLTAEWRVLQNLIEDGLKGTDKYKDQIYTVKDLVKEIYDAQVQVDKDIKAEIEDRNAKILELETEKQEKLKELEEQAAADRKALNDEYNREVESRAKTLYDSYKLFDKVEKKKKVNGSTLMKNLEDQVKEFESWTTNINSLSKRGLNKELVKELQEMGPSAIAEIRALNNMSDSELQQYANLWTEKHKLAKDKSVSELEGLRKETEDKMVQIEDNLIKDTKAYLSTWNTRLQEVKDTSKKNLLEIKNEFRKKVGLIRTDTEAEFEKMVETVGPILKQVGQTMIKNLADGIGDETYVNGLYKNINDIVANIGSKFSDAFKPLVSSTRKSGENATEGFIDGMNDPGLLKKLNQRTIYMVNNVIYDFEDTLDEHSPSKVFEKIGKNTILGFINGMLGLEDKTITTSKDIGNSVIDSMTETISQIYDVINGDIDVQPTIRPVIDLSDVSNGIGLMDEAFNANRSISLGSKLFNNDKTDLLEGVGTKIETSNDKLTSVIESLRNDFNNLASKVDQMQIIMDTGALVGAIAPNMNNALGDIAKLNRRGVI